MDHVRHGGIVAVDLHKRYGAVHALRGVSLSVPPGTVLGYLGRNGQGKTTTVRILATLTSASGGRAEVAGHDVATEPHAVRGAIGVTLQEAALDPEMTGREHLELVAGLRGDDRRRARRRADQLLEELELTQAAFRTIRTYSGGMRRRLDLASALLHDPAVLFLDEPTTGLDAQSRRAIWTRVRGLRDAGTAVLLTTQYIEEADQLADQVAIVDHGRIVAAGTPPHLRATHRAETLEDVFVAVTEPATEPEELAS